MNIPISYLARVLCHVDRFDLCVIVESVFAIHTAAGATGNTLATIGQSVCDRVVAIDLASSIAELLGQFNTARDFLGPYACSQTIGRAICQFERLFSRTDWADCGESVEDFQRIAIGAWRGFIQSGLQIIAVASRDFCNSTAKNHLTTSLGRFRLRAKDASLLCRVHHCAELRALVALIADF